MLGSLFHEHLLSFFCKLLCQSNLLFQQANVFSFLILSLQISENTTVQPLQAQGTGFITAYLIVSVANSTRGSPLSCRAAHRAILPLQTPCSHNAMLCTGSTHTAQDAWNL